MNNEAESGGGMGLQHCSANMSGNITFIGNCAIVKGASIDVVAEW